MNPDPFANRLLTEFDTPFDDMDGLAAYLLSEENDAPVFCALRGRIGIIVHHAPPGSTPIWNVFDAGIIRGLSESRGLFAGLDESAQITLAWRVLDRAVEIARAKQ